MPVCCSCLLCQGSTVLGTQVFEYLNLRVFSNFHTFEVTATYWDGSTRSKQPLLDKLAVVHSSAPRVVACFVFGGKIGLAMIWIGTSLICVISLFVCPCICVHLCPSLCYSCYRLFVHPLLISLFILLDFVTFSTFDLWHFEADVCCVWTGIWFWPCLALSIGLFPVTACLLCPALCLPRCHATCVSRVPLQCISASVCSKQRISTGSRIIIGCCFGRVYV